MESGSDNVVAMVVVRICARFCILSRSARWVEWMKRAVTTHNAATKVMANGTVNLPVKPRFLCKNLDRMISSERQCYFLRPAQSFNGTATPLRITVG